MPTRLSSKRSPIPSRASSDGRAQEILRIYDDPAFADLKQWRLDQGLPLYPTLAVISAYPLFVVRDPRQTLAIVAINGILASGQTTALGLVPTGSGNDFAKACGIDTDWQRAATSLAERIAADVDPRAIDAGRCNSRYFCNGVGIGFDAFPGRELAGFE